MITKNNLKEMIHEMSLYETLNMSTLVSDRLNKTLLLYIHELNNSYSRILSKKTRTVVKELSK